MGQPVSDDDLLAASEVARILGVTRRTVTRFADNRLPVAHVVADHKIRLFRRGDVLALDAKLRAERAERAAS